MTTAFITAVPMPTVRSGLVSSSSVFTPRRTVSVQPVRRTRSLVMNMDDNKPQLEKIPQGFTVFSEQLNGRAAMMGFVLAMVTEAITGKGIIGQVGSIFDIVNLASALGN